MTTQELKQQIEKVLGNSIRCLLPSYWWKRLFHQVADRIDEVEQSTSELIEASKMPIVESESNLSQLDLPKGSVAAAREVGGSTVKMADCYFSTNREEDWEKYTIVKRVEEKANITIDKESTVWLSASKEDLSKDSFTVNMSDNGPYYGRAIDNVFSRTTLSKVNEALSSGNYRAVKGDGVLDQYFTFYSEIPRPELYIKGETWERIAKESDLEGTEGGEESSSNSLFFYAPTDANTEISDVEKQHNAESYLKIAEGFETDKYYDVKVLMSTSQLVTFDAIQILNPAIDDGKLKLLFLWDNGGKERMVIVTSDGSATIEDVGTSASGADFTFVAAFDSRLNDTTTTSEKIANRTNARLYYQRIQNGIKPEVTLKFSFRESSNEAPVEVVPSFVGMVSMYNGKYLSSYGANAMVFAKLDIGDRVAGLTFDLIIDPDIGSILVPHIDVSEINILHARVVDNAITSDGLSSLVLKQNQELYRDALSAPVAVYVSNTRQLIPAMVSQGSGFLAVYAGDYVFEFYNDGTIVDHPIQKDEVATVEYVNAEVAKKVDKVEGKQLSTEDFTTALKTKLEGLSNYDDTEISNAVARLRDDFDSLTQEDISAAIENFNEIISFLDGIEDSESLDSIIASIEQQIANKQDKIEDLETIRSGAALGATALQEHQDISHLATKEALTALENEVIADEEVYAAAVTDLNNRLASTNQAISDEISTRESLSTEFQEFKTAVTENEEVWATSLTDINDRITENYEYGEATYSTKIELQTEVEAINTAIVENEEVIAATLTDLNSQIAALNVIISDLTTRIETLENA